MIIGHERNLSYLERLLARGAVPHAMLFTGPRGVGKRAVALEVAQGLLCETSGGSRFGCGECRACELVSRATHPDLILLSRETPLEESASERQIGIAEVHELRRRLALGAWSSAWRVAIIDGADRLTRDAQSALLKTLEEPGADTLIVLIAESAGGLFDTIRSRAIELRFSLLSDAEVGTLLGDVPPTRRRAILELAAGRPGVALALARDPLALDLATAEADNFAKLHRAALIDQFAFSESVSRDPERLAAWFRFRIGELRKELHSASDVLRAARSSRLATRALNALALLESTNVNRRMLADTLSLAISPFF